ncbi:MAG: OPT/YSL family transporter [Planctomycetes bacterium]|nr:OPT/YSL family transporter [Planctomycetota bacterium]
MSASPSAPRPYREITWEAVVFGVLIGVVMNAAITYSGLKIGFTIGGSAIAAVLGWGVLRGLLGKGTVVENNIAQTVASSVNTSNSGVIFTVPVLYLLGLYAKVDLVWLTAATMAGAILGVAFIIPTRKQMIDYERLRFPTGTAVASVLRSPGEGVRKATVLIVGVLVAMVVFFFTQSQEVFGISGYAEWGRELSFLPDGVLGADTIDVGKWILSTEWGQALWNPAFDFKWAIAPFALGAGFITGRPGLVVLAGGLLAYFVISPVALSSGWMPADVDASGAAGWALVNMNRPLGIGLLTGGAFIGLCFAFPAIGSALKSIARSGGRDGEREELPLSALLVTALGAFALLFFAAEHSVADGDPAKSALIAGVGTLWMWFAGIVIAQCTGMTDWSPISGIALLTVMVCLFLTDNQVVPAVLIGAAVCVAITECADMMQDLKTGSMVGGSPVRQQLLELAVVWIGPAVSLAVVGMLAATNYAKFGVYFGPGTDMPAPQAAALEGVINTIRGGDAPVELYGMGGLVGALLSLSGMAGLGVLVGLSMYLPLKYLLPYGLGCLIQMLFTKAKGAAWTESWCVPFAAGMIVGEGLLGILFAGMSLLSGGQL